MYRLQRLYPNSIRAITWNFGSKTEVENQMENQLKAGLDAPLLSNGAEQNLFKMWSTEQRSRETKVRIFMQSLAEYN